MLLTKFLLSKCVNFLKMTRPEHGHFGHSFRFDVWQWLLKRLADDLLRWLALLALLAALDRSMVA